MNKSIREVKLISRHVLESVSYYSKFNPLYYAFYCWKIDFIFSSNWVFAQLLNSSGALAVSTTINGYTVNVNGEWV